MAIIVIGFVLLGMGMAMLALSSTGEQTGFFFVFPFIIISGFDPAVEVVMMVITLGIVLWFVKGAANLIQKGGFENDTRLHTRYLRVDSLCDHCESPLPAQASFCPICGKPIDGKQKRFGNES